VGTRFDVESGDATTRLNVDEGTVRLTRVVDGSVVDVSAEHQVIASLNRGEKLTAVQRVQAVVVWSSQLSQGAKGSDGEWLPADATGTARLRAQPQLLSKTSRGPVTIHRVGLQIPWQGLETLQLKPDSHVRVSGRMTTLAPVEIMLSTKRLRGGFAGNYFIRPTPSSNHWQLDLPVSEFRKARSDVPIAPEDGLQLRRIVLYTIGTDAGLEIETVEVVNNEPTQPQR